MTQKNWIVRSLVAVVILFVLVFGGLALYRLGYARGVMATANADGIPEGFLGRPGMFFDRDDAREMPFYGRPDLPTQSYMRAEFPTDHIFGTRSFISPFSILLRIALLTLFIWLVVKLVKSIKGAQSWQLTFQREPMSDPPVETVAGDENDS